MYCEMVRHGGGFTFIPKSAVKKGTLPNLVPQLFLNQSEALLYIQKKDGSQTFTLIRQLEAESHTPLVVLQNTNSGQFLESINKSRKVQWYGIDPELGVFGEIPYLMSQIVESLRVLIFIT